MKYYSILFCIALLAGCTKAPSPKGPLKIGLAMFPGYGLAYLAKEKGFFKKNGVDVELVMSRDATETIKEYRDGYLDGLFVVRVDVIMLNAEGKKTRTVFVLDRSETADVLIARPDVKSLAGLNGKRIGCEGYNSFSHLFVTKVLEKAGIKEGRFRIELVPAMDILKALNDGRIDAGHTWEPVTSQAKKAGYQALATASDVPGLILDVLAFDPKVIEDRPADIKAVIRSLLEARDFLNSNRAEAVEIMAKALGMTVEELEMGLKGLHLLGLKENIEIMKGDDDAFLRRTGREIAKFYLENSQILKAPDFNYIILPRFVNELGGGK